MAGKAFFLMRLNDHVQYLKHITDTLDGKANFAGSSHTDCKLGQWIYGEGEAEVATLADPRAKDIFDKIKDPHEKFHSISKTVLEKHANGDAEGAKKAATEMHVLSTQIYNRLLDLDGMK